MNPSIWIYGGVHGDPGSRRRFLEEIAKQEIAPHFVAVEWEESVFDRLAAWRPWVEKGLQSRWGFLTREDCYELSLALGWEGDAYKDRFPGADRLWLETGFQEADLKRRCGADANKFPESRARGLLERLCNPCRPTFQFTTNAEPSSEPRSKRELIDCVWRKTWLEALPPQPEDFNRDPRWATAICERGLGLRDGWIPVVVGWAHADPAGGDERLRGLLSSKGFPVIPVRLVP